MTTYALGVDYGSDSVRVLLVDTATGEEIETHVVEYPRWSEGLYCDPVADRFRQHPLDYLESLQEALSVLWRHAPKGSAEKVVGISFDTTGSTPVAVDREGIPLALKPEFSENPNAMFVLWKDHTAVKEALEITTAARQSPENYIRYEGGVYSSEWYWAKALHVMREDPEVRAATWSWVEHCDWLPAVLTGTEHPDNFRMGRCAAGHKMMWHESWGGFPPNDFLCGIDPLLDGLRDRLPSQTFTSDKAVGALTAEWADKLGMPEGIPVGFGAFDCHMGAVAANVASGVLTKVMGTSTCDITVASYDEMGDLCVRGICGQVDGSVLPGMVGLEAGQSAFGDLYAWFNRLVNWPVRAVLESSTLVNETTRKALAREIESRTIEMLSAEAAKLEPGQNGIVAMDWVNGRRTPDADRVCWCWTSRRRSNAKARTPRATGSRSSSSTSPA
jgi:L-ribulokinase